jgi:hypothetical protein
MCRRRCRLGHELIEQFPDPADGCNGVIDRGPQRGGLVALLDQGVVSAKAMPYLP